MFLTKYLTNDERIIFNNSSLGININQLCKLLESTMQRERRTSCIGVCKMGLEYKIKFVYGDNQLCLYKYKEELENEDLLLNIDSENNLELNKNRLIEINEIVLFLIDKEKEDYDAHLASVDLFKQSLEVVKELSHS